MAATEVSAATADAQVSEELAEAGAYATAAAGFDHGLVALAMGHAYWLEPEADGATHRLLVERGAVAAVREQLEKFDRESVGWPPREVVEPGPVREMEWFIPLLWWAAVVAVFWAQEVWPGLTDAGSLNGAAVWQRGEWWRIATALFLHADLGHVTANGVAGLGVFAAVLTVFGRWRGGWRLAAAALVANAIVAVFNVSSGHASIGASTAVFAALGLLTGRAGRIGMDAEPGTQWRGVVAPLVGGATMLALYGAGDAHTDVLSHLVGFVAGMGFGVLGARSR